MNLLSTALSRIRSASSQAGFTMIELLIVIAILGILATAVLSAINPVEQINRGRDTGSRSDAEQLLSAIDRFNAFSGFFPWQTDADDEVLEVGTGTGAETINLPVVISAAAPLDSLGCNILDKLSDGLAGNGGDGCAADSGTNEIKSNFVTRILNNTGSRALYIYNRGLQGDSTYICFIPQSQAFLTEAKNRCLGTVDPSAQTQPVYTTGPGLSSDVSAAAAAFLCGGGDAPVAGSAMICLP